MGEWRGGLCADGAIGWSHLWRRESERLRQRKGAVLGKESRLYPLELPGPALLRARGAEALEQLGDHLER